MNEVVELMDEGVAAALKAALLPAQVRSKCAFPVKGGRMVAEIITFDALTDGKEHVALRFGPNTGSLPPLVRLHSECVTGDVFGSQRCDCGPQLDEAMETLEKEGGYLLYLRQEGRGIGLNAKMDAYVLQMAGMDTYQANLELGFEADLRDYSCAAQMLHALGHSSVRLLSNNPDKAMQLERYGIRVAERVATGIHLNTHNESYLRVKKEKTGHTLAID